MLSQFIINIKFYAFNLISVIDPKKSKRSILSEELNDLGIFIRPVHYVLQI